MEPIRSKTASNLISSHSDPLILWKNSQIQALATLAKKKSEIPQPGKGNRWKTIKIWFICLVHHLTFAMSRNRCVIFRYNTAHHSCISSRSGYSVVSLTHPHSAGRRKGRQQGSSILTLLMGALSIVIHHRAIVCYLPIVQRTEAVSERYLKKSYD